MSAGSDKNCGTCKFWLKPADRTDYNTVIEYKYSREEPDLADKLEVATDIMFGVCNEIKLEDQFEVGAEVPLATVQDGSDYKATLYTQSSFGCVLWQERVG